MPSMPFYLSYGESTMDVIQESLERRENMRRTICFSDSRKLEAIPLETVSKAARESFRAKAAMDPMNVVKNRYSDIFPYDSTRVVLPGRGENDGYINASWITEPASKPESARKWIACQAPLRETTHDFLSLFFDPLSHTSSSSPLPAPKVILMLTACVESGRQKCARYWPERVGQSIEIAHYTTAPPLRSHHAADWTAGHLPRIKVEYVSSLHSSAADEKQGRGWRTNKLRLSMAGKSVEIDHIEYLGWQDHGVPDSPEEVVKLADLLTTLVKPNESLVTHCSAGVGRTGSLICIAWLLPLLAEIVKGNETALDKLRSNARQAPLGPLAFPPPISSRFSSLLPQGNRARDSFDPIMAVIDGCRDQRTTMVQTSKQVEFVYDTLRAWWKANGK